MVDSQDSWLQHAHLLALHLVIIGYTLRLFGNERLLIGDLTLHLRRIEAFNGESKTFGPLWKQLIIDVDGTWKDEAE